MREDGAMWLSSTSGSSGERPTPEQLREWRRRMSLPENEFPAGVGLTVLLGRSSEAAVGITQMAAYSTGFQFTLSVRLRRVRPDLRLGGLSMLVSSHHRGVEIPLADRLLLGIEYPDGQRASTLRDMRMPGPGPHVAAGDQQLVLLQHGGGGGELSVDQTYWVSPLPADDGPVTFVLAWPNFGMPESRTVVDGAAIRAAADRSQLLWPPQPAEKPWEPPPPPRPSDGWFAEPND
jgi:hypothetical protein